MASLNLSLLGNGIILAWLAAAALSGELPKPNIVLIVADDLGYGDMGCFGNTSIKTPNLDLLAKQGVKLTHNIAADTLCTPSRAAFLTGRYPIRSGMASSFFLRAFLFTASAGGLPSNETTIGELAKMAGYKTAFFGKWHQGWSVDCSDPGHHHPNNQGFDYFYGIPLTNLPDFDEMHIPWIMTAAPHFPFQLLITFLLMIISVGCLVRVGYMHVWLAVLLVCLTGILCGGAGFALLNMKLLNSFMFRNYDLVEQPVHLPSVTRKLIVESKEWLQDRYEDHTPFLLILSFLHVHTALATSPSFINHSAHGRYGDAVEEMDWGVGQVMDTLDLHGMTDNTFVYFTSDHGGSPKHKDKLGRIVGGFNGPFKGAKAEGSTEGSFRVPGIVRWPAIVPPGQTIHEPVSLMDIFPTVADLLHIPHAAAGSVIDGASLIPLLVGEETLSPHEFLFHYCQDQVHAVRYRPRTGNSVWKLMLREPDPKKKIATSGCDTAFHLNPPKLFDLTSDPTAALPLNLEQHSSTVLAIRNGLEKHLQTILPIHSQFAWLQLIWQPWRQPCCKFPRCVCQDSKFHGQFLE